MNRGLFDLRGKMAMVTGASKASDFITGQTIYVDGGWTIW